MLLPKFASTSNGKEHFGWALRLALSKSSSALKNKRTRSPAFLAGYVQLYIHSLLSSVIFGITHSKYCWACQWQLETYIFSLNWGYKYTYKNCDLLHLYLLQKLVCRLQFKKTQAALTRSVNYLGPVTVHFLGPSENPASGDHRRLDFRFCSIARPSPETKHCRNFPAKAQPTFNRFPATFVLQKQARTGDKSPTPILQRIIYSEIS